MRPEKTKSLLDLLLKLAFEDTAELGRDSIESYRAMEGVQEIANKVSGVFNEMSLYVQPYEYMADALCEGFKVDKITNLMNELTDAEPVFSLEKFKKSFKDSYRCEFDEVFENIPFDEDYKRDLMSFMEEIDGTTLAELPDVMERISNLVEEPNKAVYKHIAEDLKEMSVGERKDMLQEKGKSFIMEEFDEYLDDKIVSKELLKIQDAKGILNMSSSELANMSKKSLETNMKDEVELSFVAALSKLDIKNVITKSNKKIDLNGEEFKLSEYNPTKNIERNLDTSKNTFNKFDKEKSERFNAEKEKLSKDNYVFADKILGAKYKVMQERYNKDVKNINEKFTKVQKAVLVLDDNEKIKETMATAQNTYNQTMAACLDRFTEQKEGLKKLDMGIYDKDSVPFVNIGDPKSQDIVKGFVEKSSRQEIALALQKAERMYEELDKEVAKGFIKVFASSREDCKDLFKQEDKEQSRSENNKTKEKEQLERVKE